MFLKTLSKSEVSLMQTFTFWAPLPLGICLISGLPNIFHSLSVPFSSLIVFAYICSSGCHCSLDGCPGAECGVRDALDAATALLSDDDRKVVLKKWPERAEFSLAESPPPHPPTPPPKHN